MLRLFGGAYPHGRNLNGTLAECWGEIVTAQDGGAQVFLVVNEGGQKGAAIARVRAIFIDADNKPLPDSWHAKPDFLVTRDAVHWHAYWLVFDMPPAGFTEAQDRLRAYYGTDHVSDLPRVLRLAGTLHRKDPPKGVGITRLVAIEGGEDAVDAHLEITRRTAAELLAGLPPMPTTKSERRVADPDYVEASRGRLKRSSTTSSATLFRQRARDQIVLATTP